MGDDECRGDGGCPLAVRVSGLDYSYGGGDGAAGGSGAVLSGVDLRLERGSRCLLVGDNGAGKSTLLRILGGKHLAPLEMAAVLGRRNAFSPELNALRSYLGGDWGKRSVAFVGCGCPMSADIAVGDMMPHLQRAFPARRAALYRVLRVDPAWNMSRVSDGQRRRVQIMLGLLRPFEVLLLDEITTDLDVCTRLDLLAYLRAETEARGVTVVYATHIFDGLAGWPTDVLFLHRGRVRRAGAYGDLFGCGGGGGGQARGLTDIVAAWIREARAAEDEDEDEEGGRRGGGDAPRVIVPDGSAGGYAPGRLRGVV